MYRPEIAGSWGGQLIFSPPKTAKSRRSMTLDPVTLAALRRHRELQREERMRYGMRDDEFGLVFTREDGSPVRPDSVTRQFGQLSKAAGVPKIRVHDLRHMYGTIALTSGAHAKVVAERLGHSTIGITLDICPNSPLDRRRDAVTSLRPGHRRHHGQIGNLRHLEDEAGTELMRRVVEPVERALHRRQRVLLGHS